MKALIILMWLTGLNIGDAVRLPMAAVKGNKLVTRRKKAGEPVHITLPDALVAMTGAGDPDGVARTVPSGVPARSKMRRKPR